MGLLLAWMDPRSANDLYALELLYHVADARHAMRCKIHSPMAKTSCLHMGIPCMRLALAVATVPQAV